MIVNLELDLRTQRAYKLFVSAINPEAPRTLIKYDRDLSNFMKFAQYSDYDTMANDSTDNIQKNLEDYVMEVKGRGVKRETVKSCLSAPELFFEMNKKVFFKKVLHNMFPKDNYKKGNPSPYSNEDILKMLDKVKSKRSRAIIHFFASTGARPAVVDDPILKFKNVVPMPNGCKAVFLYDESREEYWAFLTPEASKALDDYVDERIFLGEKITQESPVFLAREKRIAFDPNNVHPIDHIVLSSLIQRVRKDTRLENHKTGARFEKGLFLGFRKRFNTILKIESEVNSNIAEKLMAHKRGLDGVYFVPTREECFKEFVKAIPALTLSESEKLKVEVENLTEDKDTIIKQYEDRLAKTEKILEKLLKKMD